MKIFWIFLQFFLTNLGFLLAFILLLHILKERKSPPSTIAWLLAIILIPYIGVPLYIVFGGRKIKKTAQGKNIVFHNEQQDLLQENNKNQDSNNIVCNIFPLREGNNASLILSGEKTFQQLLQFIKTAKKSIYIATFILSNDDTGKEIIDLLTQKAREGLEICLLLDALGSHRISGDFLGEYKSAGGKYAFFMPMIHHPFRGRANLRNHRKMILIDFEIGGMNLSYEYLGSYSDPKRWKDISLSVEGPIVNDLYSVFRSDWKFATKEDLPSFKRGKKTKEYNNHIPLHLLPSGPDVEEDTLYDTIITSIFTAQKRIWIVTPYFIPDELLLKSICIAAKRNVDIRIIIPKVSNHRLADVVRRNYLREIQKAGAKIFLYKPGMVHGKVIIIDDSPAIIGSMNIDMRSFFLNFEIALFIYSKQIVSQLDSWINNLMKNSELGIKKTNMFIEFIEGFVRLLSPLL